MAADLASMLAMMCFGPWVKWKCMVCVEEMLIVVLGCRLMMGMETIGDAMAGLYIFHVHGHHDVILLLVVTECDRIYGEGTADHVLA